VKLTDPNGDLFDKIGNSIADQPYLDILGAEVYAEGLDYVVKIQLKGPPPTQTPESQLYLEWDIYVEADKNPASGEIWPMVTNDIGADYFARLILIDNVFYCEVREFITNRSEKADYKIKDNIIELRWSQNFRKTDSFYFIVAAKKYGERGKGSAFMLADKAPNVGHSQFPPSSQEIQSGLPKVSLASAGADIFYNSGNEDKAKGYGDAFDFAYTAIGKELGAYPKKRFILYVYITQQDLVQGLQQFGGFSPENAAYFNTGGAPRPINYMMHIWPGCDWHGVTHEYTHSILEEISGDAYKSVKYIDEGLAEYLAYTTTLQTKYKDGEIAWGQSRITAVKNALNQGKLISLPAFSTESQWASRHGTSEYDLLYAESYAVGTYMVQKYGVEKCVSILKSIKTGETRETSVQKVLGISEAQLEDDFKAWLQQQK
jgi:hypothetical protein